LPAKARTPHGPADELKHPNGIPNRQAASPPRSPLPRIKAKYMLALMAWIMALWQGRKPLARAAVRMPDAPAWRALPATFFPARKHASCIAPIHAPPPRLPS